MLKRSLPAAIACLVVVAPAFAQGDDDREFVRNHPDLPSALSPDLLPEIPGIEAYIVDEYLCILLGKALFWDQQAGSDGMACASCHFHAGADNRFRNQLSPSVLHTDPDLANKFDPTATGGGGPNYTPKLADFPFRQLADPEDRESDILFDLDDVFSSSGVFRADFVDIPPLYWIFDECISVADELFNITNYFTRRKLNTRRVEPRNTPTTINAAFNFRNFWDCRANNVFNGIDPFGNRNPDAFICAWDGSAFVPERVELKNSSLASQAVGPPLSDFEMSCRGRDFPTVGRKLLDRRMLQYQYVAHDDSVLGPVIHSSGVGIVGTYRELIKRCFAPRLWNGPQTPDPETGYTQMEKNFSLFWGLAIQCYERTLVSHETKFDAWRNGDEGALNDQEIRGLRVFLDDGKCINCHKGPDFTGAGLHLQAEDQEGGQVERMLMGRPPLTTYSIRVYDNGHYNIGVRPTREDIGVGGEDPWGNPLSFTRQWLNWLRRGEDFVDPFHVDPTKFEVGVNPPVAADAPRWLLAAVFGNDSDAVDGAFKTSGLRNVELTGPFFHNGGQATLEQVVAFYNRGGDVRSEGGPFNGSIDSSGFGHNGSNLDADITALELTAEDQAALVAFLKCLTDERVRWEKAPFDHPMLFLFHGHRGNEEFGVDHVFFPGAADDKFEIVPPIGKHGRGAYGPIQPFHTQLR